VSSSPLKHIEVHREWEQTYEGALNEAFYRLAFDFIVKRLAASPGETIVDLGCGRCAHSLRLAQRGFKVEALDFYSQVLARAREVLLRSGSGGSVHLHCADITALPFADGSFRYALCWGVLMHIPEIEKAIGEIARVLRRGGILVVGESNMHSLQSLLLHPLARSLGRLPACARKAAGLESWIRRPEGRLLVRHADIGWLVRAFEARGMKLRSRTSGQFTELYTSVPTQLAKKVIHAFNNLWFRHVGLPHPAFGNILIFDKFV
jgi:ubiquinone/menaquinone biosynthesis C-methylase UbiE